MGVTALLPMKAHSARVPQKNFRTFIGKPLYRWILDTLLSIDAIDRVIINTDGREELAETGLAERDRVCIRDRKRELCGDFVSMNRILADDLEAIDANIYLMTHTTNPLLSAGTIYKALKVFEAARAKGAADSLFAVNKVQTRFYQATGAPINHDPNNLARTQDLEPIFEENSSLYIFTRDSFRATGGRIGVNPILFDTPKLEALEIDDAEDWFLTESVALRLFRESSRVT